MPEPTLDQKNITAPAALSQLPRFSAFVEQYLDELMCSEKIRIQIRIAVDEIFSNIARHSDASTGDTVTAEFHSERAPRAVVITFKDNSHRFDPLAAGEPDITVPARTRKVGGLGLFMLKKMMDNVSYEYRDGQNILTIRKIL